jgi:hypothetical protein
MAARGTNVVSACPSQAGLDLSGSSLAGLGGLSETEVTWILETGLDPSGKPVRPPMHVYHLSHQDAAAIVAYLKTLPPAEQ